MHWVVHTSTWNVNTLKKKTYEPLHEKTYNLDWRHNLLKQRHKSVGKILTCGMFIVHVYFCAL